MTPFSNNQINPAVKDLGLYNPINSDCVNLTGSQGGIGVGITCFVSNFCFALLGIGSSLCPNSLKDLICPSLKGRTDISSDLLISSGKILSDSYKCFLRVINPSATFGLHSDLFTQSSSDPSDEPINLPGLFWDIVTTPIASKIQEYAMEKDIFYHHVMSRAMGAVFILASIVVRSVDLCIGFVASVFSLCSLGTNTKINTVAALGLQGTGVVRDIIEGTRLVFDPQLFL